MAVAASASPNGRAPSSASRHRRASSSSHSQKKPWESRGPRYRSSTSRSRPEPEEVEPISRQHTHTSTLSKRREPKWWKIRLFKGMVDDIKRRAPYYGSDWKDAWDYRVIPATVYMYFAKYVFDPITSLFQSANLSNRICPYTRVEYTCAMWSVRTRYECIRPLSSR